MQKSERQRYLIKNRIQEIHPEIIILHIVQELLDWRNLLILNNQSLRSHNSSVPISTFIRKSSRNFQSKSKDFYF